MLPIYIGYLTDAPPAQPTTSVWDVIFGIGAAVVAVSLVAAVAYALYTFWTERKS